MKSAYVSGRHGSRVRLDLAEHATETFAVVNRFGGLPNKGCMADARRMQLAGWREGRSPATVGLAIFKAYRKKSDGSPKRSRKSPLEGHYGASGKTVLNDARYDQRYKRGRPVATYGETVLQNPKLMPRVFPEMTRTQHTARARAFRAAMPHDADAWNKLVDDAVKRYGNGDGHLISGVYRSHFPEAVKTKLRYHAYAQTLLGKAAFAHETAARMRSIAKSPSSGKKPGWKTAVHLMTDWNAIACRKTPPTENVPRTRSPGEVTCTKCMKFAPEYDWKRLKAFREQGGRSPRPGIRPAPSFSSLEAIGYERWKAKPTLESGHTDNLKYDDGEYRVWVSRMTLADYDGDRAAWMNDRLVVEKLIAGRWTRLDRRGRAEASPRARKTKDTWVLQANYGYGHGWEDTHAEDTWKEMKERLREYRTNAPEYPYRAVKRRVRIVPAKSGGSPKRARRSK